jgi:hypothetical protein
MKIITIDKFTTNAELMMKASGLNIKPVIYKGVFFYEVIEDINKVLLDAGFDCEIEKAPGRIEYLRLEAERLDRALYIISCLVDYEDN